jgi:hypothetical protein
MAEAHCEENLLTSWWTESKKERGEAVWFQYALQEYVPKDLLPSTRPHNFHHLQIKIVPLAEDKDLNTRPFGEH